MKKDELVSVIMPAYNAEKYIGDAIESVLGQTYPHFELIIVDDASQDRTVEVVRSFADERIKLIRHKTNRGPGAARNTAIDAARGKWMAVIDADDQWLPQRLERLVQVAKEAGEGYFISDDLLICFETPSGLKPWVCQGKIRRINFNEANYVDFDLYRFLKLKGLGIKPFISLNHVKQLNIFYTPECFYGEDFEFVCHLFRTGLKLRFIKDALYLYRLTPGSLTSKNIRFGHLSDVYKRLIASPGFTMAEKQLFEKRLKEIKAEMVYSPFSQALKQRRYGEALRLAGRNPLLPLKFLWRLPKSIRYRLIALKYHGVIR